MKIEVPDDKAAETAASLKAVKAYIKAGKEPGTATYQIVRSGSRFVVFEESVQFQSTRSFLRALLMISGMLRYQDREAHLA